jgi:hypothetical protein
MAQVLYYPGADPLSDRLSDLQKSQCEEKFDDFLDSLHICFFKHDGLLKELSEFKQYTIFLPPNITYGSYEYYNKIKVFFKAQPSFFKKKLDSVGYFQVRKNQFNNIAKPDIGSALLCCYSIAENDFAIKPLASIRGYLSVIERHMPKQPNIPPDKKKNIYYIRLTPKITKKIRAMENDKRVTGGYGGIYPKRRPDGMLELLIGNSGQENGIFHKDYYLITQDEFAAYLKQHNNYPEGWKLKFKLIRNLLTKEF